MRDRAVNNTWDIVEHRSCSKRVLLQLSGTEGTSVQCNSSVTHCVVTFQRQATWMSNVSDFFFFISSHRCYIGTEKEQSSIWRWSSSNIEKNVYLKMMHNNDMTTHTVYTLNVDTDIWPNTRPSWTWTFIHKESDSWCCRSFEDAVAEVSISTRPLQCHHSITNWRRKGVLWLLHFHNTIWRTKLKYDIHMYIILLYHLCLLYA